MHNAVFNEELGCVQGMSAKIHAEPGYTPQFCKARPVPFALHGRVEREVECLHESGIIEPVEFAEWLLPLYRSSKAMALYAFAGTIRLQSTELPR